MDPHHKQQTYFLLIATTVIWGVQPLCIKWVLAAWSPVTITAMRYLLIGSILNLCKLLVVRSLKLGYLSFVRRFKFGNMLFVRSLIVSQLSVKLLAKTIGLSRLHIPLCGQRCYLFGFADYNLVTLRE